MYDGQSVIKEILKDTAGTDTEPIYSGPFPTCNIADNLNAEKNSLQEERS